MLKTSYSSDSPVPYAPNVENDTSLFTADAYDKNESKLNIIHHSELKIFLMEF
jgi:hypothetical protein